MIFRDLVPVACIVALGTSAMCQPPAPVVEAEKVVAAPAKAPEVKSFGPLPAFTVPKGSKVDDRGLVWRMNHYMAGQRVVAVGYGEFRNDIDWSDEEFVKERTVLGKLQMISAKQSPEGHDLIPFKVGGAYVIAPDSREEPNLDLSKLSDFDVSARGLLLDRALLSIPANQLGELGSDNGVAVSSLSRDVQAAIARAFRPPLRIVLKTPSTYKADDGLQHSSVQEEDKGRLDDPIDWSGARVRARLATMYVTVDMEPYGATLGYHDEGLVFRNAEDRQNSWADRGLDLPLYSIVPNTYKPSDLAGKAFTQPLNAAGVWTVEELLQRLQKATGLRLFAARAYSNVPVFIGSNSVTIGEAIDALRLGLTAAWRRLGNAYVLAWDRAGIQTVQQLAHESAEAAGKAVKKMRRDADTDSGWAAIADRLPYEPSDPMSLDSQQRKKVFGLNADDKPWQNPQAGRISFAEMTPEQQAWVRAAAAKDSVDIPSREAGAAPMKRPFTDDDIAKAYIQGSARVNFCVLVPGVGWVRSGSDWDSTDLQAYNVAQARRKLTSDGAIKKRNLIDEIPKELRDQLEHPLPFALPAPSRGVMVPPLGAARLAVLMDEMKRHGLNTLFYPVLFDGYATFQSKAFGLHPALRGADGWAAAAAAAKPAGIKLVGYLNTLAWQEPGDNAHYLNKHPEWVDVDVAGRGRLEWFSARPDMIEKAANFGVSAANYVRPLDPNVSYKLQTLTEEFARKPGAAGICFAEWSPPTMGPMGGPFTSAAAPPLGFALADRIAELNRTGEDPVDRIVSWDDFVPPSIASARYDMMSRPDPKAQDPHVTLVLDLMKRAKAVRKDLKTYLVTSLDPGMRSNQAADVTKAADENLASMFLAMMGGSQGKMGALMPVTSRNLLSSLADEAIADDTEIPYSMLKMPSVAMYGLVFRTMELETAGRPSPIPTFTTLALDFRTSPEEITPSMQWVKAPSAPVAAPKAPAKPAKP